MHEIWVSEHDVHDDGLLILPHRSHISNLHSAAFQMGYLEMIVLAFYKHTAQMVASDMAPKVCYMVSGWRQIGAHIISRLLIW